MERPSVRTRFAPSPTGLLHLGNARTALFNALLAYREGGTFLLRIEDTDAERSRERYVAALVEDLRWLGLDWQEGPDVGGRYAPYRQSERGAVYDRHFEALREANLSYPCFCGPDLLDAVRRQQTAAGLPPRYPGTCARLSAAEVQAHLARGEVPAWRFRVPGGDVNYQDLVRGTQRFATGDLGDFIIRRADGSPAFLFSNALDDALMEVTHVLRGEDHISNTPRQLLLLQALELAAPRYGHLPLIHGSDDSPLAKRHGTGRLCELRERGYLPEAIVNYLVRLGHPFQDAGLLSIPDLAARFSLESLGRASARYDEAQLLHWQREAVAALGEEQRWRWWGEPVQRRVPREAVEAFVGAVKDNVLFPLEAEQWATIMFGVGPMTFEEVALHALRGAPTGLLKAAAEAAERHGTDFQALVATLREATGLAGKALFQPLRAALTGRLDGPQLARIAPLMGAQRIVARLREAAER